MSTTDPEMQAVTNPQNVASTSLNPSVGPVAEGGYNSKSGKLDTFVNKNKCNVDMSVANS